MGETQAVQADRGKKAKKHKDGKEKKGDVNAGGALPSVRYVSRTTFKIGGVVKASATRPDLYLPIGAGIWSSIVDPVSLSSIPQRENNSWEFELDGTQPQHQATVTAICLAASDDTSVEGAKHRTTRGKRGHKKAKELMLRLPRDQPGR